ncbi:MAG: response regulator transcription factor [Gammaproteobacteria bacterium]|nr:response regulator transcription factor [Gammaproteobacteria bacterium]
MKNDNPHSPDELSYPSKILIAEDDEAMRMLLSTAILGWGYEVVEASDGEEAWKIMQSPEAPSILILDWLMPKLNGVELCERIRASLDFHPYIIFLTQVSGVENMIKGLEAGANEFLLKPVNFQELRIRVFAGSRIVECLQVIDQHKKELAKCYGKIEELELLVKQLKGT